MKGFGGGRKRDSSSSSDKKKKKNKNKGGEREGKFFLTLFTGDLNSANIQKHYAKILATKGRPDEGRAADDHFKRSDVLAVREMSALECFMIHHPNKQVENISPSEFENLICYPDNVSNWDRILQCMDLNM